MKIPSESCTKIPSLILTTGINIPIQSRFSFCRGPFASVSGSNASEKQRPNSVQTSNVYRPFTTTGTPPARFQFTMPHSHFACVIYRIDSIALGPRKNNTTPVFSSSPPSTYRGSLIGFIRVVTGPRHSAIASSP